MTVGRWIVRLSIIAFWIVLIFATLYFPSLKVFPFEEKSIYLFTWGNTLDPEVLADFERQTGIKVHLNFYSSNEELLVKMKATRGEGYDLVMPSDYAMAPLIKENLLIPLDRSKLHFWNDLNPALLNHPYDPENLYSVPFEWEIYGFAIDKRFFRSTEFIPTLAAIYDKEKIDYRITLNNDPIEAISFAALYLYGKTNPLSEEEFLHIRALLLEQRAWVEAYSNTRADYLVASGNSPVAISISSYTKKIRQIFPYIEFAIPLEGTFITIENVCIPNSSKKQDYVYAFLNFLYSKESLVAHNKRFSFLPATISPIAELNLEKYEEDLFRLKREDFNRFHFFQNAFPQQKIQNLWVEVKSF